MGKFTAPRIRCPYGEGLEFELVVTVPQAGTVRANKGIVSLDNSKDLPSGTALAPLLVRFDSRELVPVGIEFGQILDLDLGLDGRFLRIN